MPDLTTLFGPTERTITRSGERHTVQVRRPYDATPRELWSAWTRPDRVVRWLGEVSGDRVVGGTVRLMMSPPDADIAELRIETCEEPQRLVAAWSWPGEPDSRVELLLEPAGDSTVLTLTHSLVAEENAVDYGFGWEDFLNRLTEYLADRDPAIVSWSDAQQHLKPLWQAAAGS